MKKIIGIIGIFIVAVALVVSMLLMVRQQQSMAGAPAGMAVTTATSSYVTIPSHTVVTLFASSTCVSRIIGHASSSFMLTFFDSVVNPSGITGHRHIGSTTVAYDSGIYGCGIWRVYNPSDTNASTTITEFTSFR